MTTFQPGLVSQNVCTKSCFSERLTRDMRLIRGQKVILDADIAALYGLETGMLVRALKRNLDGFPPDFMFQLSDQEFEGLRSQSVTSSSGGGRLLCFITNGVERILWLQIGSSAAGTGRFGRDGAIMLWPRQEASWPGGRPRNGRRSVMRCSRSCSRAKSV